VSDPVPHQREFHHPGKYCHALSAVALAKAGSRALSAVALAKAGGLAVVQLMALQIYNK